MQLSGHSLRAPLHVAADADANGVELIVTGNPGVNYVAGAFQISGTLTSVIVYFECTLDGTNWVALECTNTDDSTDIGVSATAAGVWTFNALGLYKVRARLDHTTGSVTVWGSLIA